jgi:uncharacterized membrane protein YfcA
VPMLLGSIPGVFIGSLFTGILNAAYLRRILGLVIALAAMSILFKTLGFL